MATTNLWLARIEHMLLPGQPLEEYQLKVLSDNRYPIGIWKETHAIAFRDWQEACRWCQAFTLGFQKGKETC